LDPCTAFQQSAVCFVVSSGLALSTLQSPTFDQLIVAAQNLPHGMDRSIGRTTTRTLILDELAVYHQFSRDVNSDNVVSYSLVFDVWSWGKKRKLFGAFIRYVTCRPQLKLITMPILLAQLKGVQSNTIGTETSNLTAQQAPEMKRPLAQSPRWKVAKISPIWSNSS